MQDRRQNRQAKLGPVHDQADDDPPPVAPRRPENDECCGGGCNPCVFDLYEDARERYERALAAWRARHPDSGAERV
jgi:hypothetical protein